MFRLFTPVFGVVLALFAALAPSPASAQYWQCVGYAREITGVAIRGNANTWWGQAEGRYERGKTPRPGAVLAFKSIPGMPAGHVAVVSEVVNDRELLLTHANWSRGGQVERNVRAIDVSEAGDWSAVRVWYGPLGGLGTRTNPTFGFIYPVLAVPVAPHNDRGPLIGNDIAQLAAQELVAGS